MSKVVLITLGEYRAIMQFDDDGACNADLTYEIVPDLPDCDDKTSKSEDPPVPCKPRRRLILEDHSLTEVCGHEY